MAKPSPSAFAPAPPGASAQRRRRFVPRWQPVSASPSFQALAAAQWPFRDLRTVDLTNAWAHRNLLLCYRDRLQLSSPAAEFSAHLASVE